MYKILVADDEPRHRRGLSNMIRSLRPGYEVFEAKNGKEALDIALSNNIDVIITDIKMPIIGGLELIEKLKIAGRNAKIIILSGYAYFEYAQKAVTLGAFDYILKPVDEEKINNMLCKVEKAIEDDRKLDKEKEIMSKKLNNAMPVYLAYQFNKWINGNLDISNFPEIKEYLFYDGCGMTIITEIEHQRAGDAENIYSEDEWPEIFSNIEYWLNDALSNWGKVVSFHTQNSEKLIISILATQKDISVNSVKDCLERLLLNIQNDYNLTVTIGVGNLVDNIFENAQSSYKHARTVLCYKFYLGTGKVIAYDDVKHDDSWNADDIYKYADQLIDAVRNDDKDLAESIIDVLFENAAKTKICMQPDYFVDIIGHILYDVAKEVYDILTQDEYNQLVSHIRNVIFKSRDCDELKMNMIKIVHNIMNIYCKFKNDKDSIIMQKCLEYIQNNYQSDISLETVAETFYFNPSYFSTFFKKNTGCTFSQYLLKIRLGNALNLLKNTDNKVYEISKQVGYNDVKYFIRVFKKEYGLAPEEYRRVKFGGV